MSEVNGRSEIADLRLDRRAPTADYDYYVGRAFTRGISDSVPLIRFKSLAAAAGFVVVIGVVSRAPDRSAGRERQPVCPS
jgi:hypothetical protein